MSPLDPSPREIALTRILQATLAARYYREADIASVPLPDATYHAATLHFVLHELPAADRPAALANLARTLRPDGLLYLREPAAHGLAPVEIARLMLAAGFMPLQTSLQTMPLFGTTFTGVFTVPHATHPSRRPVPMEPQA